MAHVFTPPSAPTDSSLLELSTSTDEKHKSPALPVKVVLPTEESTRYSGSARSRAPKEVKEKNEKTRRPSSSSSSGESSESYEKRGKNRVKGSSRRRSSSRKT